MFANGEPAATHLATLGWSLTGPRQMVLGTGPPGSADAVRVVQPSVVRAANGSYLMYYTGYDGIHNRVLMAYSPDGITWTRLGPIIDMNDGAGSPFVLHVGSVYHMWFESVVWSVGPLGYLDRIYSATSTDGLSWTLQGIVLDVGNASSWDGGTVGDPVVVRDAGGFYRMFYGMWAANGSVAIGVATSSDLVVFTKWSGNPVLPPAASGAWDDVAVTGPSIVVSGSLWTMFYDGRRAQTADRIGVASSTDGYRWIRAPVPFLGFDSPGSWDSLAVGGPDFVQDASTNRLYFDGTNSTSGGNSIGLVTLTSMGTGGNSEGASTILGIPAIAFFLLVLIVGVSSAGVVAFVLVARGPSHRR